MEQNKILHLSVQTLLEYLPKYERESQVFFDIYSALIINFNLTIDDVNDIVNQLFIETATWGLEVWERALNIPVNNKKPYKERRAMIKEKLVRITKVSTESLRDAMQEYYEGEVRVAFDGKLKLTIPFEGDDPMHDYRNAIRAMENLKPAHLGYEIVMSMQPITTSFYLSSYMCTGEETIIYPTITRDPEINPKIYISANYGGLAEVTTIGAENIEEMEIYK